MSREERVDVGALAAPRLTPQGFMLVEGIASRVGVFDYVRADGTIQKELRLPEDVFGEPAMSGYQGATLTKGHPGVKVTPENARRYSVGTVLETARKDGDHVRVKMVVQDADAIAKLQSKQMRALSSGYSIDLEETSGIHPVYGRYDAIQRNLVINHLALCEDGRAGPVARVRVDSGGHRTAIRPASWSTGWRADAGMMLGNTIGVQGDYISPSMGYGPGEDGGDEDEPDALLTSITNGHQHSIDPDDWSNDEYDGTTSLAMAEGATEGHTHEYLRSEDGTYTISMNAGHTHTVLSRGDSGRPKTKHKKHSATNSRGRSAMTTEAQKKLEAARKDAGPAKPVPLAGRDRDLLIQATSELAREKARADDAVSKLAAETARADAAEGYYEATQKKLEAAEALQRDDALSAEKDEMIERLTHELETVTAERDDALDPNRIIEAANLRVGIMRAAGPLLGIDKMDGFTNQELMIAVIEKCQGEDVSAKKPEYIQARFDGIVKDKRAGALALDKIRSAVIPEKRVDASAAPAGRDKYLKNLQEGWKTPPNASKAG